MTHGVLGEHRYRLIAFDWDGTAVTSPDEEPHALAEAMERLLAAGVILVIISSHGADDVSGQIAPLLPTPALGRLYLLVNRGSEVFGYSSEGDLEPLWQRDVSAAEADALDAVARGVQAELRDSTLR